ncbi:hypothetical protein C8R46DRAFT_866389, partial [Mycena filopes]
DLSFLAAFFRYWEPSTIFILARLNFRLLNVVRCYQALIWNVPTFLSSWFRRPLDALNVLHSGPAIICGPSVLQFLDRSAVGATRLDLCVGFAGMSAVGRFLRSEGYSFRPVSAEPRIRDFDLVTIMEATRFHEKSLKFDGDRTTTQQDHGSRSFRFLKFDRSLPLRAVIVHLVRCEFHRFIFSMHSTALANFISSTHIVSTFPRSTFLKRKSFIACQERTPEIDDSIKVEGRWLRTYEGDFGRLRVVGNVTRPDRDAETGLRWIGDSRCWSQPAQPPLYAMEERKPFEGPAFEVLDWINGVTRHGSYLRIGEPFV